MYLRLMQNKSNTNNTLAHAWLRAKHILFPYFYYGLIQLSFGMNENIQFYFD